MVTIFAPVVILIFLLVMVGVILLVVYLTRQQSRDRTPDLLARLEEENERLEAENEQLEAEIAKLKKGVTLEPPATTDIKQLTTNN